MNVNWRSYGWWPTGTPNKLISDALGLAEKTIKWHLSNIFEKLGVQDRTSAATVAMKRGIIPLE